MQMWNDDFTQCDGGNDWRAMPYTQTIAYAAGIQSCYKNGDIFIKAKVRMAETTRGRRHSFTALEVYQFLQNHDQLANSGTGKRAHLLTSPSRYRRLRQCSSWLRNTHFFSRTGFAASAPFSTR